MPTRIDGHVVSRPSPTGDVPGGSAGAARRGPGPGEHALDDGSEVTVRLHLDGPHPMVSVVGALGRPGGALLAAVFEYLQRTHGGPVTVDLSQVSDVDRDGLAAVVVAGAAVEGASLRVGRVLTGLAGSLLPAEGSRTPAGIRHPALPGGPSVRDGTS